MFRRLLIQREWERELVEVLMARCQGLCEICGRWPDWRGLSLSHTKPKGMGGTRHVYTEGEVQLICGRCHSQQGHGLREV